MTKQPCIMCRSTDIKLEPSEVMIGGWYAECQGCGATGVSCETGDEAIEFWNDLQDTNYASFRYFKY